MKRMAALIGALLLTLVLAAPAAAVKPVYWYDDDFVNFYPAEGNCGDFVVDVREVGHARCRSCGGPSAAMVWPSAM